MCNDYLDSTHMILAAGRHQPFLRALPYQSSTYIGHARYTIVGILDSVCVRRRRLYMPFDMCIFQCDDCMNRGLSIRSHVCGQPMKVLQDMYAPHNRRL